MKVLNNIVDVFKRSGWEEVRSKDDVSVRYDFPDICLDAVLRVRAGNFGAWSLVVSTVLESKMINDIDMKVFKSSGIGCPLSWSKKILDFSDAHLDECAVARISDELISWAKSIDVEELINQLAAGPLGETAVDQTNHLCALALKGKVLELYEYEQQLETWKKPMLLPFINKKILSTLQAIAATKASC